MGTVPAKNRCFEKYILKYPFRFSGKVRKSWSRPPSELKKNVYMRPTATENIGHVPPQN